MIMTSPQLRAGDKGMKAKVKARDESQGRRKRNSDSSSSVESADEQAEHEVSSWVARQRVVNSSNEHLMSMLMVVGLFCAFSLAVTVHSELRTRSPGGMASPRGTEAPALPGADEYYFLRNVEREAQMEHDTLEQNMVATKSDSWEQKAMDSASKSLEWIDAGSLLEELTELGFDPNELKDAPADLLALAFSIRIHANAIKALTQKSYSVSSILQQDLLAIAELVLMCRMLSVSGNIDEKKASNIREKLEVSLRRFRSQWNDALYSSRYIRNSRTRVLYARLVELFAIVSTTTCKCALADFEQKNKETAKDMRKAFSAQIAGDRFDIIRLLDEVGFSTTMADVFKTD